MLVVCAGTGTEVGKTWVGVHVLGALRAAGLSVTARKPAQSFDPDDAHPTDGAALAAATGDGADAVCPPHRSYPVAMAPPMAADALGREPPTMAELIAETTYPVPLPDVRWLESVGGVRSPLAIDGDTVELCRRLSPDLVVLVADAGLGTINAVRLSVAALEGHPVVVFLNRYVDGRRLDEANRRWLTERDGLRVATGLGELVERVASV